METPFQVPVSWKRRLTPEKVAKPARITSSERPASAAVAIAASAFSALCWPGIGIDQALRLRSPPLTRGAELGVEQRLGTVEADGLQHEVGVLDWCRT